MADLTDSLVKAGEMFDERYKKFMKEVNAGKGSKSGGGKKK